ncbi:hypothetical protein KC315_g2134 [Hortaea werneckii]|nr:hypothetical protein KC315_g2134 [Hortaea werneckii]
MVTQHGEDYEVPKEHHVHRPGGWLPADSRIHKEWLGRQIEDARKNPKHLVPVLQEFKDFIEGNTRVYMWFNAMFDEIPVKKPYANDPTGHKQIRDYHHMLEVLNHTFTTAPHWTDAAANVGMVGVPLCAILDYPMGTPAGYAAFLDPDVNRHLKKILNEWGKFLQTPQSAEVLGEHNQGWFGQTGKKDLMEVANAPYGTSHSFESFFNCDPKAKHYGYKSWDDFFTRTFKDEVRPVASPENDDVIANACESKVFNLARGVKLRDHFWIKGQPYSVLDILAHDQLAESFAGGIVYQAFLSALSYHRWHAPVSGISTGQGYLSHVATRAIIFIEADNPKIGLMAFVGIGMDEVSTCDITVKEGQHVKKGEQLGMFHFGGSTHCLLFRKGVKVEGFPQIGTPHNIPVRGQLAMVTGISKMASEAPPAPATASTPPAPSPAAAAPAAESPVKQEPTRTQRIGMMAFAVMCAAATAVPAEHMTLVNDSCLFHCIAQLPFKWLTVMGQRRKVRDRFGIEGTPFKDCCATFWCTPCASAQMNMELKNRAAATQPPVAEEPPAQPAMAYTPPPGSPAPADPPSEKPAEPAPAATAPPALPPATAPPPKDKALPPPPGIVNTPALIH